MTQLQEAINEVARLISDGGYTQDEIKDRARRLARDIPGQEKTKIPRPKCWIGHSYFSDEEKELAYGSYMDDLTLQQTAYLISLAYDQIIPEVRS